MSKINLLLDVVSDLRSLADSVQAVADAMCRDEDPAESPAESTMPPVSTTPTKPEPTLEAVRAVLADKSREGHTTQIRSLLQKYGAAKLSDIAPANYKALLADVEGLGDAT